MKKNDLTTVTIEDMGVGGEGIGKVDGYTLFVKDAVIGDVAEVKVMKAKKHYGYARLMKILQPSKDRVEPVCPVARQCGGCQIQALNYEKQLEFKHNKVRNNLIRLGGIPEELLDEIMEPAAGMKEPFRYRNKAQFPFGRNKNGYCREAQLNEELLKSFTITILKTASLAKCLQGWLFLIRLFFRFF